MGNELLLSDVKNEQLKILDAFAKYCDKNNIKYSLAYGTMLGAVRHKGYIPWDDDIDIMVSRQDYESLIRNKNITDSLIFTSIEVDKNFPYPFGKVINTKTVLIENADIYYPNLGINIDIFPIDNFPQSEKLMTIKLTRIALLKSIHNIKVISKDKRRGVFKNSILLLLKILLFPIPKYFILRRIVKIAKRTKKNYTNCGIAVWGYGKREVFNRVLLDELDETIFEGRTYKISRNYDFILNQLYGNYMVLPPKENQVSTHEFKAYIKATGENVK